MANAALTAGTRVLCNVRLDHARDERYTPQERIAKVGNVQEGAEESHRAWNYLEFGGKRSLIIREALMWLHSDMFHKAKSARQPRGMYMTTFCTFGTRMSELGLSICVQLFSLVERLSTAKST